MSYETILYEEDEPDRNNHAEPARRWQHVYRYHVQ